jgi:thioredoxin-like negative regulator of GroEL
MFYLISSDHEYYKLVRNKDNKNLVVVAFTSRYFELSKKFIELSNSIKNVYFYEVNVDKLNMIADNEGINMIPTFRIYKNEFLIDHFSEVFSPNKLKNVLESLLNK